jgi:small subunit ribosomal protein S20
VAHTKSAQKRIRQSEVRRLRNKSAKSRIKTSVKKFNTAVEQSAEGVDAILQESVALLNKGATKGVIHKNAAARKVSRLTRKLNAAKAKA